MKESSLVPQPPMVKEDALSLEKFHFFNGSRITGPNDVAIRDHIKSENHLFILGGIPYLYSNGCYRPDLQGVTLKKRIERCLFPQFIKSSHIKRIYELFLMDSDLCMTEEQTNKQPVYWINFQNGFFDPINRRMVEHDPKYYATSQVAVSYNPNEKPEGAALEDWLQYAVENREDREMMLEYFGYCLTRDTRQQKFLIIQGVGGTGKSTLIKLLEHMIGDENISHISLSELTERFAAIGLKDKQLNSCSELSGKELQDTARLKKITGEDVLRGEAKGKDAISFRSCAKLIFATNDLPLVKNEKNDGFYRRLLVLTMNRKPEAPQEDFFEKLEMELPYFLHLCVDALERMYQHGKIEVSPQSTEAIAQLRYESDPVEAFLMEQTDRKYGLQENRVSLHRAYLEYCMANGLKLGTRNEFYRTLRVKGYAEKIIDGSRFFCGISLKPKQQFLFDDGEAVTQPSASSLLM